MKEILLALVAVGCLGLWTVHSADAQSWGRGGAYTGAGSNPDGRILARRYVQRNGGVPKFCYSLATGKFTHWGPCRRVLLPTGQYVKVAH
jgi:hypothetical protein